MSSDLDTEPADPEVPQPPKAALGDADTLASDSTKTGARRRVLDTHARVRNALFDPGGAPTRIGEFSIERPLGSGGMGTVYLACDTRLDRQVALKLVRSDRVSEQAHARLLREAKALGRLAHPNVVPVFEVGEHEGLVYVAMEYVVGATLREALAERPHEPEEVLAMFRQAGEGLVAAHAQGLVHRDFKPDNVLVGADGRVRVVDFGLVAAQDEVAVADTVMPAGVDAPAHAAVLTRTGDMLGTPAYMSPEQYEGRRTGPATDQFAFCVALYEALEGERPFTGETLAQLAGAVVAGEPREFSRTPGPLRAPIRRGLERDPEARFDSMSALLDALELPAAPEVPAVPGEATQSTPARRPPWRLVAIGVVGVALVGTLAAQWLADQRPPPSEIAPSADVASSPADPAPADAAVDESPASTRPERLATGGKFGFHSVATHPDGSWVAYSDLDSFVVLRRERAPKVFPFRALPFAFPTASGVELYAATEDELLRVQEDGSTVPVPLEGDPKGIVTVSPDLRRVVVRGSEPDYGATLVDLKGEAPDRPLDFTLDAPPRFSADGRWLAVADAQSPRLDIYSADGRPMSSLPLATVQGFAWDGEDLVVGTAAKLTSDNTQRMLRCPVREGMLGSCTVEHDINVQWTMPLTLHGRYGDGWLFTTVDVETQRIHVLDLEHDAAVAWSTPAAQEHSSSAGWVGDADLAYVTDRFGAPTVSVQRIDPTLSASRGEADNRHYLAWGLVDERPRILYRYAADGTRTPVVQDPERVGVIAREPSCAGGQGCIALVRNPDGESFNAESIDPSSGSTELRWPVAATRIRDYSMSPDGTRIALLTSHQGVVMELESGRVLGTFPPESDRPALAVALADEGKPSYAAVEENGGHQVWRIDPDGGEEAILTADDNAVACLKLSPTGRWLAVELTQVVPTLAVFPGAARSRPATRRDR